MAKTTTAVAGFPKTKGSYIPKSTILEELKLDEPPTDREYSFILMALKARLERDIYKETGRIPTIKSEDNGLRILTDSEAVDYNDKSFRCAIRKMYRAHRRQMNVDVGNLTNEQKAAHAKSVTNQATLMVALESAAKRKKTLGT